jgi:YVTN family beta-propeller protein
MIRSIPATLVCLAAVLFVSSAPGSAQGKVEKSGYHLLQTIAVGGEGGWDYVFDDSDAHRLYVSHATKVIVIDTDSEKVVGEIPNFKGVHGITVAPEYGRGFVSDGRDDSVSIFDTKTLKIVGQVKTGKNPDSIMYDPATKRVFAFNGGSSDATAITAVDGKVAGTIALGGRPEFATGNGKGMIYVNIEDKSEVVAIDAAKLQVVARWPLAPGCEEPSGMAIDQKHDRVFSVCSNKSMSILNVDTGKVVSTLPIGDGADAAGFDAKDKLVFSSNGDGTLTITRPEGGDKYTVIENVPTQRGARTMAVDQRTHRIYLPTAHFGPAPAPTKERPRPRPTIVPNSFVILVFGRS